ncbi:MAG: hypothetical protein JWN48_2488 [Myxococcaceae bacterium]|nr:hypothetical protein [Myxococcaceae bacterium]
MSPQRACAGLLALCLATACQNDPYPTQPQRRSTSAEIYHFVCKRVARENAPNDPSGTQFDAACDGRTDARAVGPDQPRLQAMLSQRDAIIEALGQSVGDLPVTRSGSFEDGELKDFLKSLVPFYDDDTLPGMTQKIAALLDQVLDTSDPRATAVLDRLAAISPREGYRPANWALGAVRPFLSYERLDALSKTMLTLFGEGGDAHDEFTALLKAAALELADEAKPVPDRNDTTLHTVLDLLLTPDPALSPSGEPKLWTLKRDLRGLASTHPGSPFVDSDGDGLADVDEHGLFSVDGQGAESSPYPFRLARGADPVQSRDADGLARASDGAALFDYYDANQTVLAAGMREAKPLIQRDKPGEPSTIENVARGLRALLGPNTSRSYQFGARDYAFQGPDLTKAPLLDLLHAVGVLLAQPETRDVLELVQQLMSDPLLESSASAPIYAALQIDARADDHPEAFIGGVDGKAGSPHEFWDDALFIGTRMLKREGLIFAIIEAFSQPLSAVQGQLFGDWMQFNDVVTYKNAPFRASGTDGKFTDAEKADLNAPLTSVRNSKLVDRSMPDVGMNRSLWQRTMSLLHTINGSKLCNKEGASLTISDPLPLSFPTGGTYKKCDFVEIPDPGEAYVQALLKRLTIALKDQGLNDLATFGSALGIVGSTSEIQERESQIDGFTAAPTGPAMARFMFGPSNKFIADLFGDIPTKDGVPLKLYEPYALFPMEILNDAAKVDGVPQSFITASEPLITAFDDHELRGADKKLLDGYMFGHLLDLFHTHWSSRKAEPCPDAVVPGVSEGCTQSLDPDKPFYSPQSNLVSYEPLLKEAFVDEQLTAVLQKASVTLKSVKIASGKAALQVLSDFVTMLLRTSDKLAYRDGRTWSMTNTCVAPASADPKTPPAQCDCPLGASADAAGHCTLGGRIVPRGKIVPISPAYIMLDALKGFDHAFQKPEYAERLAPWRAARSALVDRFLGVDRVDADSFRYTFKNQNARQVASKVLGWLVGRIDAHQADLEPWALGLTERATKVLEQPLVATGLDVLDAFWKASEAGDEFAAVASSLMDPSKDAFGGIVVATADTLTFVDREPELTPIVRFASLAVAPNAFSALDGPIEPNVVDGVAYRGLELTRKVVNLHTDDSVPSPLSKLLKNLVLVNDRDGSAIEGESPIEQLFDAVAQINRTDASAPDNTPMAADDLRSTLRRMSEFLKDKDRGLERIYSVIKARNLDGQVQ